jgi:hypothetical protein
VSPRLRIAATLAVAVAAAVVIGLALTGSGSSDGSEPPPSLSAGADTPHLQSRLLTADQLPAGWETESVPSNGIGCLADLIEPPGITVATSSETDFAAGQGLPEVVERLATYPDVTAAYAGIVARLNDCKYVNGEIDGARLSGTLRPVAFAHYGPTSAAFAATFTGQDQRLADDVAIVRRGRVVMGIDEGGYAPIDARQFTAIVTSAARKLS